MVFGKWVHFELACLDEILSWLEGVNAQWQVIPAGTEVCEMDGRVSWGYFMEDAGLGAGMRRGKLPVTCMFRLKRGLGQRKSQSLTTETRSKPGQWFGVQSFRSQ